MARRGMATCGSAGRAFRAPRTKYGQDALRCAAPAFRALQVFAVVIRLMDHFECLGAFAATVFIDRHISGLLKGSVIR